MTASDRNRVGPRGRGLAVGVWASLLAAVGLAAGASATPDSTPPPPRTSVRDSPGWYPVVDPESMSVVIGRRLSAPLVNQRFHGGARSLDDLGRAVCRALHHGTVDSLRALCVGEDEFRDILWREFPQSRPVTGLASEDAWTILHARLHSGCNGAVSDFGGRYLEFLRFERAGGVKQFRNFKLHNGLVLVARNDLGDVERFTWLRSVAERKGAFKIYSVND